MKLPKLTIPKPPRAVVVTVIVVLGVCIIVTGASATIRAVSGDRILPGVSVGGIAVGGTDRATALQTLQTTYDAMLDAGLGVEVNDSLTHIDLRTNDESNPDAVHNIVDMDLSAAVNAAYDVGRNGSALSKLFRPILSATLFPTRINVTTTLHEQPFKAQVTAAFPDVEYASTPIGFDVQENGDVLSVQVTPSIDGQTLNWDTATELLVDDANDFQLTTLIIPVGVIGSDITVDEAAALSTSVDEAMVAAPYTLSYTAENRTEPETWEITKNDIAAWIAPGRNEDGGIALTLDATKMADFLATLHEDIDVAAQNARFAMENNRVSEFAASHDGVTVNDTDTIRAISDFLGVANTEVLVMVDRVTPTVTTESVNNLGISEVLGVGTSDFKNSPANRIANITHGAEKLNGLLIAPGETVSLLDHLKPFTIEDGYLPELVIKGDEIKPEIGGGLCQIGTTTFRAVMNSGLHVVERRNHSLVVSYYNDPSNDNPGTDATIYDPAPDFKFENDTANYILLATEVNLTDKKLYFTFWGTSDKRVASYTPPEVLSWSGYGATTYKTTDTLAPGVEKCQAGHPGATTTFTYNISYADGTTHTEEFFSSYRSLPKICLVGNATAAPVEDTGTDAAPTEPDTSTTEELSIDTSIE
ncbi:MAG: VanW family protein [Patescibacteria group bacterium]